jgi:hypothetical protein
VACWFGYVVRFAMSGRCNMDLRKSSATRAGDAGVAAEPDATALTSPAQELTLPLDRVGVEGMNVDFPTIGLLSQHKNFSVVVEHAFTVHYDRSSDGMMCANDGDGPVNINGVINKGS